MTKLEKIVGLIHDIGYRARLDDETIHTHMSGWAVLVFPYSDDSIQMYFGVTLNDDDEFGLEQANELNKAFRFLKSYIVKGAARFEQDFFFDISKPTAQSDLEKIFLSWERSLGTIRNALQEARGKGRERNPKPTS